MFFNIYPNGWDDSGFFRILLHASTFHNWVRDRENPVLWAVSVVSCAFDSCIWENRETREQEMTNAKDRSYLQKEKGERGKKKGKGLQKERKKIRKVEN